MFEQVKELLQNYTTEPITENSMLAADLGFTSFDLVEIVCAFEDRFDIEIPDRDIPKFTTVRDIVEYLER